MPVKSAAQFRFMEGIAHGMKPKNKKKGAGPSKAVAEEFLAKTSHSVKSNFAKERR